jgi:hypothetical protein
MLLFKYLQRVAIWLLGLQLQAAFLTADAKLIKTGNGLQDLVSENPPGL